LGVKSDRRDPRGLLRKELSEPASRAVQDIRRREEQQPENSRRNSSAESSPPLTQDSSDDEYAYGETIRYLFQLFLIALLFFVILAIFNSPIPKDPLIHAKFLVPPKSLTHE
jgi:hypothetical protein